MARQGQRREPQPAPPPLPPETRTVGQLVAETIRLYGGRFWGSLALGIAPAAAGLGLAEAPARARLPLAFTVAAAAASLSFALATGVVAGERIPGVRAQRNEQSGRDRAARLLRHRRIAPGRRLARIRRRGRPGAHARAAPLVPPRLRTRARGSRTRDRLSRNARARRAADGVRPLLHPPVRRYRGAARVGVPLRPRDLPAALPRRRAPLFRPAGACRLVAPTEEDRCRRTSCCPT